eukprot:UN29824
MEKQPSNNSYDSAPIPQNNNLSKLKRATSLTSTNPTPHINYSNKHVNFNPNSVTFQPSPNQPRVNKREQYKTPIKHHAAEYCRNDPTKPTHKTSFDHRKQTKFNNTQAQVRHHVYQQHSQSLHSHIPGEPRYSGKMINHNKHPRRNFVL